ncbi:hypothetical protein BH10PSE12_BH10PSE12_02990 [soil metagenome]
MAFAVEFAGWNKVYGPPPGRDDVAPRHFVFVNGACIVSCWELSDEELAEVNRTRRVFVSSMSGMTLFPMFVGAESVVRSVVVDYGKVW